MVYTVDNAYYRRGDIVLARLPPSIGSVQSGVRPVVILQNNVGNRYAPTLVITPLTARLKRPDLPTHCILEDVAGLKKVSMALLEQIHTIDKSQVLSYIGQINKEQCQDINAALAASVGHD